MCLLLEHFSSLSSYMINIQFQNDFIGRSASNALGNMFYTISSAKLDQINCDNDFQRCIIFVKLLIYDVLFTLLNIDGKFDGKIY